MTAGVLWVQQHSARCTSVWSEIQQQDALGLLRNGLSPGFPAPLEYIVYDISVLPEYLIYFRTFPDPDPRFPAEEKLR